MQEMGKTVFAIVMITIFVAIVCPEILAGRAANRTAGDGRRRLA